MTPSRPRLGRSLIKLACAVLLIGGAAQARHGACDAAPNRASTTCVARVAAIDVREPAARGGTIGAVNGVGSTAAGGALVLWQPDRRVETASVATRLPTPEADLLLSAGPGEPPLLGLLLAVLGVVGFVAHRRSGR